MDSSERRVGGMYPCVVKKDSNDGTIKVKWDEDGKVTSRLLLEKCRPETPDGLSQSLYWEVMNAGKEVDLSNRVEFDMEQLANALSHADSTVVSMDLFQSDNHGGGVIPLAEALKTNTTLSTLDLRRNGLGDDGAIALAEALKTNTTLTTLDLGWNTLGDVGAIALAEALKTNTTLTTLDLGFGRGFSAVHDNIDKLIARNQYKARLGAIVEVVLAGSILDMVDVLGNSSCSCQPLLTCCGSEWIGLGKEIPQECGKPVPSVADYL